MFLIGFGYTYTVVFDCYHTAFAIYFGVKLDKRIFAGLFNRIADEVKNTIF